MVIGRPYILASGFLQAQARSRDRDGAELAAGGAVDRHVARRHPAMVADRAQIAERLAPVAGLLGVGHAAVAVLARLLRLRPVGDRAHDADVFGDAAIEERHRGRDAEPGERAAAADHEIEAVVEAEHARIGVDVAGAVAAAAGAAQVDGAVDVLRREAGVRDGETRGFRRDHALGTVRLLPRDDAETDDRVLSGRWMFWHWLVLLLARLGLSSGLSRSSVLIFAAAASSARTPEPAPGGSLSTPSSTSMPSNGSSSSRSNSPSSQA